MDSDTLAVIVGLVILVAFIAGGIKTFKRNWGLALILLIFLTPLWALWAFVELFTGEIENKSVTPQPVSNVQNVIVTVGGKDAEELKRISSAQTDGKPLLIDADVIEESGPASLVTAYSDTKNCPFCAETIKKEAIVCRYCNRDINA